MKHLTISVFLITLFSFSNSVLAADDTKIRNLYHIVVDSGSTAENTEERKKYKNAFIDYAYKKIKPSNKDIVIILSAFTAKDLWYGKGRDFKNLRDGLQTIVTEFDFVQNSKNYDGLVPVDLVKVFKRIKYNESSFSSIDNSVVFMYSPFLDTKTVLKGVRRSGIATLVEENQTKLPKLIGTSVLQKNIKTKYQEFFWVNSDIERTVKDMFSSTDNFTTKVYTPVRSKSILSR